MKVKIKILKENVLHLIKSTTLFYDFIVSILGLFSIILAPQILSITNIKDKAIIGVRSKTEKLLVKNQEEYTSPISAFYKNKEDFIIVTENSIYLVSADLPTKMIS